MRGFFMTLGICSILVPIPCDMSPDQRFSLKLMTAKPTMWQQQPTTAAPPARSIASLVLLSAIATHIAALDVGRVSKIPITTAIIIPIKNGVNSVARAMPSPSFAKSQGYGRTKRDRNDSRDKHCQKRQYDYIQLCSARNERTNLRGNQSGKISSYRIADAYGYLKRRKPAACVCARHTCDYAGKNRKLVAFERIGNAGAYSRAHHKFRNGCHLQKQIAYPIAVRTAEQLAQLLENRPRNQRGEKPQSHTRKSVYKPTLGQPSDHQTKAALFAFGRLCFLNFRFRCVFLFVHISPLFKLQNLFHFIHNFNKGFFVERTL